MSLSADDKEFIKLLIDPVCEQVKGVNNRLDKLNGKVADHEKKIHEVLIERASNRQMQKDNIENREDTCPHFERMTAMEDNIKNMKSVKRFIVQTVSSTAAIFSILWIIYKIFIEV